MFHTSSQQKVNHAHGIIYAVSMCTVQITVKKKILQQQMKQSRQKFKHYLHTDALLQVCPNKERALECTANLQRSSNGVRHAMMQMYSSINLDGHDESASRQGALVTPHHQGALPNCRKERPKTNVKCTA